MLWWPCAPASAALTGRCSAFGAAPSRWGLFQGSLPAPEYVLPCRRELVLTARDKDWAKERSFGFFSAYKGTINAAVEQCREQAERAIVHLPASTSAVWSSANCLFLSAPYSIILFSLLLSQRLFAVLRPPKGVALLRDPEENMNMPYYGTL